jgi:hypothetical protein
VERQIGLTATCVHRATGERASCPALLPHLTPASAGPSRPASARRRRRGRSRYCCPPRSDATTNRPIGRRCSRTAVVGAAIAPARHALAVREATQTRTNWEQARGYDAPGRRPGDGRDFHDLTHLEQRWAVECRQSVIHCVDRRRETGQRAGSTSVPVTRRCSAATDGHERREPDSLFRGGCLAGDPESLPLEPERSAIAFFTPTVERPVGREEGSDHGRTGEDRCPVATHLLAAN